MDLFKKHFPGNRVKACPPTVVYNVQSAVDAEHALIVVQKVTRESNDTCSLQPMAEAA